MQCPDCGESVADDAAYCTECGAALDDEPTGSTQPKSNSGATAQGATGQGSNRTTEQATTADRTTEQATTANQPTNRAQSRDAHQTDSSWATSRMLAAGGGVLAGVSLFLPWVTALRGGFSASGMETGFGTLVLAFAIAAFAGAAVTWGRGWGWLSMLFTGLAGVGVASAATLFQNIAADTATLSTMQIQGTTVPLAAVEPATGVQVAILGGTLVVLGSLAGIVGSLTNG